jgi:hypothetical protein
MDARTIYQRLNNGRMIVWLNELTGRERLRLIRTTIREMDLRGAVASKPKQGLHALTIHGRALLRCFSSDS